jgi:hypothetical protein
MKSKKVLTENKKQVSNKEKKPAKRNYNAKLKLDMSFKEALERSVSQNINNPNIK